MLSWSSQVERGKVLMTLPNFAVVVIYSIYFQEVLHFEVQLVAMDWQIIWVKLCYVGSGQVEQRMVFKNLPDFAGVVFFIFNFEEV